MNHFLSHLLDRMENRYSTDTSAMSMGQWMMENTNLNDKPFSFERYPFQRQIADDMHPSLVCIKPSQVGLTELQIRKALGFITRNKGVSMIYTLPSKEMFDRVSTARIRPIVDNDKVFNMEQIGPTKPTRSKAMIQVGKSYMYVTGAGEGDATSISADMVMNDEVDLTDQTMLALFSSRLQNSDYKIKHGFSTPTYDGFGIDSAYGRSDQHMYLLKCSHCNHWQEPDFTHDFVVIPGLRESLKLEEIEEHMMHTGEINVGGSYVRCEKCSGELNLGDYGNRCWVAKYPARDYARGYRVLPFSTHRLSIAYILEKLFEYKRLDFIRGWYNTVLARSHSGGDARIADADIERAFTALMLRPLPIPNVPAWVGIDMGQTCHIVVGQGWNVSKLSLREFITCPVNQLSSHIERIVKDYMVIGGCCDRHPYTPDAERIRDETQGRILPLEYRGTKEINVIQDPNKTNLYVQANRTMLLDEVQRAFKYARIEINGYGADKEVIKEHLKDMVREEEPEKEAVWKKLNGNDHYFHAMGMLYTAVKVQTTPMGMGASEQRSNVILGGMDFGSSGKQNPDSRIYLPQNKQSLSDISYGNQVFF